MSAAAEPKKTRVAVVGTGEFGRNHARVYHGLSGVALVGFYDQNIQRASAVAKEFQETAMQSLEELQGRADAVSVAVPNVAQGQVGCRRLTMARNGMVEK